MCKFLFADGEDVCLYDGGKIIRQHSKYIEKFKAAADNVERSKSWKHSGEGAAFRGDVNPHGAREDIAAVINGVYFTSEEGEAVYSFKAGSVSGIYKMKLGDVKSEETHVINSVDYEVCGGCLDAGAGTLATKITKNYLNSDIAVLDLKNGDYKTVTDGDTLDSDPFVCPQDSNIIYFSSRGVGRTLNGDFAGYSNSAIYRLNISALEVEEIAASDKYNYIKPMLFDNTLFAVRTPCKEKKTNPIVEILLIPFRIIQALANFINVFVTAFTGKSLASGGENPAKGREYDSRKEYIKGNLINVEKETKKNAKKDKEDYGFVPLGWQLVDVRSGKVVKSGVADYDITEDGTFIVTNGRRIFAVKDGKSRKLCNAERCFYVACPHRSEKGDGLFGF